MLAIREQCQNEIATAQWRRHANYTFRYGNCNLSFSLPLSLTLFPAHVRCILLGWHLNCVCVCLCEEVLFMSKMVLFLINVGIASAIVLQGITMSAIADLWLDKTTFIVAFTIIYLYLGRSIC